MKKTAYWVGLAFWLALETVCYGGMAKADTTTVPYPTEPDWTTPRECFLTGLGADGPQYGAIQVASIGTTTLPHDPYETHVVVQALPGFWLLQVRGGWIGPNGPDGFVWNNPDTTILNYEHDGYGAGFGVVVVACPDSLLAGSTTTTVSPTSSTTAPSTATVATTVPPTKALAVVATPQFTG